MDVNARFDEVASEHSAGLPWQKSPMKGVERRMLDRVGDEVARATTIVRYAAGSHFSAHTHSGGEEFIVLEGTFQDEHGDYPAGTYVRNPIGTRHIPRSDDGCTIFVKLWQFAPDDHRQFSVDLNAVELKPDAEDPAIRRHLLHHFGAETVMLEHWASGSSRMIGDDGGAELLILGGSLEFDGEEYGVHDWIRLPAGHVTKMRSGTEGARIWIKTGHLAKVSAPGA